jgi:hypothetical protein
MNTRNIINPIARALPMVAEPRKLSQAAAAGILGLGLFRRKRREPPIFAIAAGVALAAVAAALLTPSSRRALRSFFERTGGGIGTQVGKVLGGYAGAHPRKTAHLVREARERVGSGEPTSP